MRLFALVGVSTLAAASLACSGRLATGSGDDAGESDAPMGGSSGGSSSSGVSSSTGGSGGGVSGSSSGESSSSGSGSGAMVDAGPPCGPIPMLHENPPGDVYCGLDANGGPLDCIGTADAGICCLGGPIGGGMYAPNACTSIYDGCMKAGGGAIPIECNQVSDCLPAGIGGSSSCCLQGATAFAPVPACGYDSSKGGTAIVCESSSVCSAGEVQICSSNADCPSGTTCTAGKWKIFDIGFCE